MLGTSDHEIINNAPTWGRRGALYAYLNANERSRAALEENPEFFEDQEHMDRVEAVQDIVRGFFGNGATLYVTHRAGWGKPFTAVKVHKPSFPNVKPDEKQRRYLKPLEDLGVKPVFSKQTNSYLYRVY